MVTPNYQKLYEATKEQLAKSEKARLDAEKQNKEIKASVDQLIAVVNGNIDAAKSNLIQALANVDNAKIIVKVEQAPAAPTEKKD